MRSPTSPATGALLALALLAPVAGARTPTLLRDADVARLLPVIAAFREARKKNAAWYIRNRAALEPRLGELLESLGR